MSDEERSAWGRSMQAKHGGYAVQRLYRQEGRIGPDHPAHMAAQISAERRKQPKHERESAERGKHAPAAGLAASSGYCNLPRWLNQFPD